MAYKDNMDEYGKIALLIYNPRSGHGIFPRYLDHIIERFQQEGYIVHPLRGGNPGLLSELFSRIDPEEYGRVIVAGGDGTINIVVNAMMKNNIYLPLAIFPSGTANDFAYYLGIPDNIDEMIDIALGNSYRQLDVAKVNEKYYVNVAAMGTLVDVSQKTDPQLKNTIGVTAYYIKGLSEVKDLHPIKVNIKSKEFTGTAEMYFMIVMNGCSAGGFKRVGVESDASDGLLDVIIFKAMPLHEVPQLFFNVLYGSHLSNKNVIYFKTSEMYLESSEDIPTDVDGEKGEKFPLHFSVLSKRLRIMTR